jgi:hypothetical protein
VRPSTLLHQLINVCSAALFGSVVFVAYGIFTLNDWKGACLKCYIPTSMCFFLCTFTYENFILVFYFRRAGYRFATGFILIFGENYKSRTFILRSFLRSGVTSFIVGPNFTRSILSSYTLSPCSHRFALTYDIGCWFNVRDQVSHSDEIIGKIIDLCSLMFKFRVADGRNESS